MRIIIVFLAVVLAASTALAQQSVPPPPQPPANGPTLAATMQFIQDKLNDIGKISFVMFEQIASIGSTGAETEVHQTVPLTNEISNVVADQNQCRISYHRKLTFNGKTYMDENSVFSLRDVQDIVIMPYEQDQKEWDPKNNYPNEIITSTSPPITALVVRRPHGEENTFRFTDANLADRVAKAFTHAVELCGGGSKPEPF
jgi:hypothetical protein